MASGYHIGQQRYRIVSSLQKVLLHSATAEVTAGTNSLWTFYLARENTEQHLIKEQCRKKNDLKDIKKMTSILYNLYRTLKDRRKPMKYSVHLEDSGWKEWLVVEYVFDMWGFLTRLESQWQKDLVLVAKCQSLCISFHTFNVTSSPHSEHSSPHANFLDCSHHN